MHRFLFSVLIIAFTSLCAIGQDVSIYEIQFTTDPSGNSPRVGQTVSTGGYVTGITYRTNQLYYFISDRSGGLWHGILVNDNQNRGIVIGDSVHLTAEVQESSGQTRLRNVVQGSFTFVHDSLNVTPAIISCAEMIEPAEGVLVELQNMIVTDTSSTAVGLRNLENTCNAVVANGWAHSNPNPGDTLPFVRGLVSYESGAFKINPRSNMDLSFRGPIISNVQHSPNTPTQSQSDTVTAVITAPSAVTHAYTHYRFGTTGEFVQLEMSEILENLWQAIIPPAPARSTVQFFISAIDDSNQTALNPPNAPTRTYSYSVSPSMREIYNNFDAYNNTSVTLRGVVNFVQDVTTTSGSRRISAFVQDDSYSVINGDTIRYGFSLSQTGPASDFPGIVRGNLIEITGTANVYPSGGNGSIQLGSFSAATMTVIQTGVPLPPPIKVKTGDRTLQHEIIWTSSVDAVTGIRNWGAGTYCQVTGTVYRVDENVGGGTNITIDDGTGSTVIRVWDSMNLDSVYLALGDDTTRHWVRPPQMVGHVVSIAGPSSTYNGDFQLLAGYWEDFNTPGGPTGDPSQELTLNVPNRPFAPDLGQKLPISYNAPSNGGPSTQIRLRIFDLRGHLVWTYDKLYGGGNTIEWDGRDATKSIVPLGTYILHLEYIAKGTSRTQVKPIVVGTRL
jgi:hypothetical protein